MIRKIALTVGASIIAVTGLTGTADAKPTIYGPSFCDYTGEANVYGTYGEPMEIDLAHVHDNSFAEFYCERGGFRLYKSVADTASEVNTLRLVADDNGNKNTHVIFCQTSPTRARLLDLAQGWGVKGIDQINTREVYHYKPWAARYAKRHPGCYVYR